MGCGSSNADVAEKPKVKEELYSAVCEVPEKKLHQRPTCRKCGSTNLCPAVECGHLDCLEVLISDYCPAQPDLLTERQISLTPLETAAKVGNVQAFRMLADAGASIGDVHCGPMFIALRADHPDIVAECLNRGVSVEVIERGTLELPLHLAATLGNVSLVQLLLDYGANPNGRCRGGRRPLHAAVEQGHHNCVDLLLENGAIANVKDDNGVSPMDLVCQLADADATGRIRQLFMEAGAMSM